VMREQLPPDDPRLADALSQLGLLNQRDNKPEAAAQHYREALAIYERHPDKADGLADAKTNLATTMFRTDPKQAIALASEALAVRRKRLGDEHIDVWNSLINLAQVKETVGDLSGAEEMRREALRLARKLLDEKNRKTILSMNALARTLWLRQEPAALDEAESLQARAVELAREVDGERTVEVARGLDLLACIARDRGDLPRAIGQFRQAMEIYASVLGPEQPETTAEMTQLADSLTRLGQPQEAIELADRALAIRKAKLPAGDWRVSVTASVLGGARAAAGEFDKAEPLLLEAERTLRTSTALAGRPRREATERLVKLYEGWGKPDDAARWRAELSRQPGASTAPAR
jgi:tetratricopeptide (TPR) repeat protein